LKAPVAKSPERLKKINNYEDTDTAEKHATGVKAHALAGQIGGLFMCGIR
jgi:hypothetical protein